MLRMAVFADERGVEMAQGFGLIALIAAAAFAGAAFYINFAEHPARMKLPVGHALAQWKPAYKSGFTMQSSLAVVGALSAFAAAYLSGDWRWALGGGVLLANWPYTLIVILPLNNRLMAIAPEAADEATRAMLCRWDRMHSARTLLGGAATLILAWAMLS